MVKIIHKKEILSTNTWSKENIFDLDDRTIVVADKQTCGRGRFARKWISENSDNIYMSFILKPVKTNQSFEHLPLANLTQYLAICVLEVLEKYDIKPQLKWPNDILVNGKKISGILAELVIKNGQFTGLVLGLGLNLNMSDEDLKQIDKPATALNLETGYKVNKDSVLKEIIDKFFENYESFLEKGFLSIRDKYLRHFYLLNEIVKINFEFNFVEGRIIDVDEKGILILQTLNGEMQEISVGDIL
ncbi:biotin--[acetyl-CoA-carboxylase] ligase [bacterium]|nr:biotin--[acetyl-CoA-carboxylase] ligase [bacterium]